MDFLDRANKYSKDVVAGKIDACKWVQLACERQLKDLKDGKKRGLIWVPEKASKICKFASNMPHVKGKLAGQNIQLEPWQIFILSTVFGWHIKATGKRRFNTAYTEVPRKNAKSTLSSTVALYGLTADGEPGAEIYSAATSRDQAKIVFNDAQAMARKRATFRSHYGVEVGANAITVQSENSSFKPLSSEGNSLDGLNIHIAIVDELHAHKTRDVYDVLETATGAREHPLLWNITTAGSNRAGICYEIRTYLTKILQGLIEDDSFFGIIYTIDDGDNWTDPAAWAKANPNFGISVNPEDLARKCKKAMEMPSAQNNFLTKHLDVWVNADTAWMDMIKWDAGKDESLTLDDFEGQPCVIGVDLASKVDIAAVTLLFKKDGIYYPFNRYYLPESRIESSGNSQYSGWEIQGRLVATPGNVIDFAWIKSDLKDFASRFQITEIAFDPFQATEFSTTLMAEGFSMVEVRPTVLNFSEPMKELEALVLSGKLRHDGDPVLAWMVSNVVCHVDAKDNIYPRKEREENKIDGVVSLIMALARYIQTGDDASVYENREILGF